MVPITSLGLPDNPRRMTTRGLHSQPSASFFERVCIFIDGSNLYRGCEKTVGRHDIDFSRLAEKLCQGRKLIRTYYYNAPVPQSDGELYRRQQLFFELVRKVPYLTLILGHLEKRSDKGHESGSRRAWTLP